MILVIRQTLSVHCVGEEEKECAFACLFLFLFLSS